MYIILPLLTITLSLQTKLGEKVEILFERVKELWNGTVNSQDKTNDKKSNNNGNNRVKVIKPISQNGTGASQNNAMNQSLYSGNTSMSNSNSTPINQLPTYNSSSQGQQQPTQNYDSMYRNDLNPLINANTPGINEGFDGPLPANEVAAFGSA